jgi:hypothetical protein
MTANACPVCNTPLSETRYAEIQEQIRAEERTQNEHARAEFEKEAQIRLEAEIRQAEARAKDVENGLIAQFSLERERLDLQLAELRTREVEASLNYQRDLQDQIESAKIQLRAQHQESLAAFEGREQSLTAQLGELQASRLCLLESHQADLRALSAEVDRQVREELSTELESSRRNLDLLRAREEELQARVEALAGGHKQDLDRLNAAHLSELTATRNEVLAAARLEQATRVSSLQVERDALAGRVVAIELEAVRTREEHELRVKLLESESQHQHAEELSRLRTVLDEAKGQEIAQIRAEIAEQHDSLKKKLQEAERKLDQKSAHELGHWPEANLTLALREAFPEDEIRPVGKGVKGADIIHAVRYKGEICGSIVIDSKNHLQWRESFVDKLLDDQLSAEGQHAILSTAIFPQGAKDLSIRRDVILAKPNQVVAVVDLLRRTLINNYILGRSRADEGRKKDRLYQLITSDPYRLQFRSAETLCEKLQQIETDEYSAHQKVWENRGKAQKQLERLLRDINSSMLAIIESEDHAPEARQIVDLSALSGTPARSALGLQAGNSERA